MDSRNNDDEGRVSDDEGNAPERCRALSMHIESRDFAKRNQGATKQSTSSMVIRELSENLEQE
jgi:hypothetical protein